MNKEELWGQTLAQMLADTSEDDPKRAFLNMMKPFGMFGDHFVLVTNNQQVEDWVEKFYLNEIQATVESIMGSHYVIDIETINDDEPAQQQAAAPMQEPAPAQQYNQQQGWQAGEGYGQAPMAQSEYNPYQAPQGQQPEWASIYVQPSDLPGAQPQGGQQPMYQDQWQQQQQQRSASNRSGKEALFSKCTFDTFVVGSSNNFARGAALAVAEQPGNIYNPLFIYGSSGLGKTHLLVAIANYIDVNFPRMTTCYVSANEFLNDFVEATQTNSWGRFNDKYHRTDVLLVDDVQYLEGKDETINMLFNIFNEMTGQNKQIVLSADRAPRDIDMDERVRSRFMQGLMADVKPPDYETRLAIIKNSYQRMLQNGTFFGVIPDDVMGYIADIANSNIREMEGAITRLISNMTLSHKQSITIDEAEEVLQDFFPDMQAKKVTIEIIQSEVERYFNVSHDDLISSKRSKGITYPRHIAIYLSRFMTDQSLESIGKKFGGRDHTTIMHSVNKIENDQNDNRQLFDQLEQLRTRVLERG